MHKLSAGIIGSGGISDYHINGYLKAGVKVEAVSDPLIERAKAQAAKHGITKVFSSAEEMLEKCPEISLVSICTPNKYHCEYAVKSLRSGRHVFCEKPPALNAAETERMQKESEKTGKILMFNFNNRARPEAQALMRCIKDGEVGKINSVQAVWVRKCGLPALGGWFMQKKLSGGGPVIDLLHMLDLSLYFMEFPEPEWVLAQTFNDMLARLESAFITQRQLFEDLSHELKTPLTILKGEFEVVLKKLRSQEEYESLLRSSLEEVDRITRLVDNLLILASLESRKIMPEKKNLDLCLLIQSVANSIKGLAAHKGIGLNLAMCEGITVYGDEQQLKQLFLNIIDNAVKYTEKGEVKVSVKEVDDKIQFDIALVTKSKAKGGIDIKLANIGSDIESQTVHRVKFSVVDEAAQQKSWKLGKQMLTGLFSGLAQLDPENVKQITHETKPANRKRGKNVKK